MRKKALITGASRGIGAAAARALAQDGYDLFLVCKSSKEALERVRQELTQQYGICCETALCDVSNAREVETMIKNAGEIHVLVNNAAVSYVGLLTDMSLREWHQVMDTNLNSLFYICRLVVPQMVHRKEGKILNISSVWGKAEEIPAGRMGSVREAGELIRLIIGAPAYLTGQILTMDGGWIG